MTFADETKDTKKGYLVHDNDSEQKSLRYTMSEGNDKHKVIGCKSLAASFETDKSNLRRISSYQDFVTSDNNL